MRFLIVKPSSLGDIVHALFAVSDLRKAYPDAEIFWVANDSLASIVSLSPGITVIPFPRKALGKFSLGSLRGFLRQLRSTEFDAVLDFQGLLRSGLISWCARSRVRYGFANAREGATLFYTKSVELPSSLRHAADKNRYLVREFLKDRGITLTEESYDIPVEIPVAWSSEADGILSGLGWSSDKPLLAVGCSSRWESKSWSTEYFSEVLKAVSAARPEIGIWLLGSLDEASRAERVRELCGLPNVSNLAGKTSMGALAALLHRSRALFTNDSGPMHIAALLGVPCVANFGSTDDTLTGPYGPVGRHTVIHSICDKSPCFQRVCPLGDETRCCRGVSCEAVAAELLKKLS